MKRERKRPGELTDIISMIGIAVVALLLILLFKVKGGILGMVLGTIAVAALIYWLKEIKKIFREERFHSEEAEWFYDLIDEEEGVTLIARVPGPAEEVKVRLVGGMLEIKGGGNFMQRIHVPKGLQLQKISYINGVLHVRLQRVKESNYKASSKRCANM
jgi:HSP20 family molecular chaperone IbpA